MSLDTYKRKRDFGKTPEPAGTTPERAGDEPRFVVQRHRATRLHYDFRLEIEGVLVSWAIPRGPSLKPLERRMAARTEDHPIEYYDFEGVIPKGEYGGGDVIIWDWGTWEPLEIDKIGQPAEALRKGELKFMLNGERLRGEFVLVKTRSDDSSQESWLLIHKKDADSDPSWDIDAYPTSVKSGRTNDEVKAGVPAIWRSSEPPERAAIDLGGAVEGPLPDFIAPMLATPVDGPFTDPDWLFELKLDGYRVEAVVDHGKVRLWTRNKNDAATYFPELSRTAPTWIKAQTAIVDGEVVALTPEGRADFSLLQDRTGLKGLGMRRGDRRATADENADDQPRAPLVFNVFDLLYLDGRSLLAVPLEERKKLLKSVIRDSGQVRYLSHIETDGGEFHRQAGKMGLEGIVAKLRRSLYDPGRRTKAWLKVKIRLEQELVVVGYEPGQGSHKDIGSLIVATHENGAYHFAGEVGSGLTGPMRQRLRQELDAKQVADPPLIDPPRMHGARWSEPHLVIRAEFAEWTSDGLLRQAAFKGLEPGRDPRTVTRERAIDADAARESAERTLRTSTKGAAKGPAKKASKGPAKALVSLGPKSGTSAGRGPIALVRPPDQVGDPPQAVTRAELDALDALGKEGVWEVGGHQVKLTNLDKVLFPGPAYTKRDLIRYYTTIGPVLLPHVRERPLNFDRWPDGVTSHHFWQKQIPSHAPDWVARWDYPEAGKDQSHTYVVADRVATMAWLGNNAVIDLHPWTSTVSDYLRPTYALIDIDPGEKTTWDEVLVLARLFRTALEHLGVRAYPKVTGKRGIQVWVPIEQQRYTYNDTLKWVEGLSRTVGAAVPDLVSWEWDKKSRGGRARLDYTQNTPIKTLVAPYAARPVDKAGVSVPIEWTEFDDPELRPDRWDLRSAIPRVEAVGDLFAGALQQDQKLPPI